MLFFYRITFYTFLALLFSYIGLAFTGTMAQLTSDIRFIGASGIDPEKYLNLFGDRLLYWESFYNYILQVPNIFAVWITIAVVGQLLANSPFQFIFLMTLASSAINLTIFYFSQNGSNIPQELTELFSFPYTVPIASGLIALFLTDKRKIPQREIYEKEKINQKVKAKSSKPTSEDYYQEIEDEFKKKKSADLSKTVNQTSSKVIMKKTAPRDKKTLSID
ncbi:MAG: hypothetical protein ACK5LE_01715 [Alphaproteobacteria bacterium]